MADTMTIFGKYNTAGTKRLYMGTSSGQVMDKGKYTDSTLISSDNTANISSSFELAPLLLDSIEKVKKLNAIIAYADRAGGLKLSYRIVDSSTKALMPPKPLGELTKFINSFDVETDEGTMIQICGAENGKQPYWSFMGFALDIDTFGSIPKQ